MAQNAPMTGTLTTKWRLLSWLAGLASKPTELLGPVRAREAMRANGTNSGAAFLLGRRAPLAQVSDDLVAGVRTRLYVPHGAGAGTVVYFHGGGWVVGDLDSHDVPCSWLASLSKRRVVSVDYRLAPEHRAPAALDDCLAVARAISNDSRVVVAGDSAGGQLAAVTCRRLESEGRSVAGQVLVYPITDCSTESDSYRRFGEGHFLTTATMRFFIDQYLPTPADRFGPDASPLLAPPMTLPPAFVLLAECDVLHDEGRAYAERLRTAGSDVTVDEVPGVIHGFFSFQGTREGHEAARRIAAFVERVLGP